MHRIIHVEMVVVYPMIEADFNVNVEQDGQVDDVIKACAVLCEETRSSIIDFDILVSSYCMKYNPCVCQKLFLV